MYLHACTHEEQLHTVTGMAAIEALLCTQFTVKVCTLSTEKNAGQLGVAASSQDIKVSTEAEKVKKLC